MTFEIHQMQATDYAKSYALWIHCEGIGLSDADSEAAITDFLQQNPGLSFIARSEGRLIGTALCGSDGRRGYLYHLAVDPDYRHQGIGRDLSSRCLQALGKLGIQKCHIMVYKENRSGLAFWQDTGWKLREELVIMSADIQVDSTGFPGEEK